MKTVQHKKCVHQVMIVIALVLAVTAAAPQGLFNRPLGNRPHGTGVAPPLLVNPLGK